MCHSVIIDRRLLLIIIIHPFQAGMEKLMDLFDAVGGGSISFSKGLGPGASEWALQEQDKTAMPPRQVRINLALIF